MFTIDRLRMRGRVVRHLPLEVSFETGGRLFLPDGARVPEASVTDTSADALVSESLTEGALR